MVLQLIIRPIRPEDEPSLVNFTARSLTEVCHCDIFM